MDICTFWYSGNLRIVDRLCLASMAIASKKTGQRVKLYSYMQIANLPEGVDLCNAAEIMSKDFIYRLDPEYHPSHPGAGVAVVQFSDFFRVMLMKHGAGVWLDTDTYLLKAFNPDGKELWLARESMSRLGVSAMYLPLDSPIITEFEEYMRGKQIIPNWTGVKRRFIKPLLLKLRGKRVITPNIGITLFGNDGISRLAKKYGDWHKAHNKKSFYYWTTSKANRIFSTKWGLAPLNDSKVLGFHIHRKALTNIMPPKGSFYYFAIKRVAEHYGLEAEDFFISLKESS